MTVLTHNICMFADGAGITLSFHVPASREGERGDLEESRINYRYTVHMRSVLVQIF
jgi:hypothetical protein